MYVINKALDTYNDKPSWEKVQKIAMQTDFSWNNQAKKYEEIY